MATLSLTGNSSSIARMAQQLVAACATASDNRSITVVIDDSDFSVTYNDGAAGSVKVKHK